MIREKIQQWIEKLPHTDKGSITRYYLAGGERFSIFLHCITRSDEEEVFHDHPWNGFSIILGSYWEETLDRPLTKKSLFNRIIGTKYHRVELKDNKPVWTIFCHGPRLKGWEFFDRALNVKIKMDWTHDDRQKN